MKVIAALVLIAATPLIVRAVTFREIVDSTIVPFVDTAVLPLMYALAFLFFMIGMVRFFFSSSEEAREQGKQHAFWGVIGLVVLFGVWGFVRLLLSTLGV
ncbi:pilin [Patescibacteria group bacterium]|nr:pilin [Patescibacteria group bacterium]MBU1754968.1 pilin [Patescibacteria group bacterium]